MSNPPSLVPLKSRTCSNPNLKVPRERENVDEREERSGGSG